MRLARPEATTQCPGRARQVAAGEAAVAGEEEVPLAGEVARPEVAKPGEEKPEGVILARAAVLGAVRLKGAPVRPAEEGRKGAMAPTRAQPG